MLVDVVSQLFRSDLSIALVEGLDIFVRVEFVLFLEVFEGVNVLFERLDSAL